jgi:hypothetical protein
MCHLCKLLGTASVKELLKETPLHCVLIINKLAGICGDYARIWDVYLSDPHFSGGEASENIYSLYSIDFSSVYISSFDQFSSFIS